MHLKRSHTPVSHPALLHFRISIWFDISYKINYSQSHVSYLFKLPFTKNHFMIVVVANMRIWITVKLPSIISIIKWIAQFICNKNTPSHKVRIWEKIHFKILRMWKPHYCPWPLSPIETRLIITEFRIRINNYINRNHYYGNLGYRWEIASHIDDICNYLSMSASQLLSVSKRGWPLEPTYSNTFSDTASIRLAVFGCDVHWHSLFVVLLGENIV